MTQPRPDLQAVVDDFAPLIETAADTLWDFAEVRYEEVRSAAYLKELLEEHNFAITHDTVAGIPTAFVAEIGAGEPVIGILAEYDALPGLGNAPVPRREPRADGLTNGHGCGHNLIGSAAVGAALAVGRAVQAGALPGTVRLYGTPAEEGGQGKVYMARAGVFDDLDVCLHWHPDDAAAVFHVRSAANTKLIVEFYGTTAHAGSQPWQGRSALHAVELFTHGVNLMREQMQPTGRVQYIVEQGGEATNIIPDYARVQIAYRDATLEQVNDYVAWIKEIAEGAALATRTRAQVTFEGAVHDLMPNGPLAERMQQVLDQVGTPVFDAEEEAFARQVQAEMGLTVTGLAGTVTPLLDEPRMGFSTDVGDVSKIVPTMGLRMPSVPEGVSMHTWGATACHGMSIGRKAAVQAAKGLAVMTAELLTDAELREAAQADFAARMGGRPYVSPIPPEFELPPMLKR
ncbi:MAG: amidohydrolase [Caldilineaceae bacterium]